MKLKYLFYAQCLINHLLRKGIPLAEVHRILEIPPDVPEPMEHETTIEQIHELTLAVKRETGINHCGLEMVKQLNFQNTGFFRYLCPELQEYG